MTFIHSIIWHDPLISTKNSKGILRCDVPVPGTKHPNVNHIPDIVFQAKKALATVTTHSDGFEIARGYDIIIFTTP